MGKKLMTKLRVFCLLLALPGLASAGSGSGAGSGPIHAVTGTATYQGTVVATCDGQGSGLILFTADDGNVEIDGLGPTWYWESLGFTRPQIDDWLTIDVNVLACGDDERKVATRIVFEDGSELILRDADGRPLWRSAKKEINRQQQRHQRGTSNQPT